MNQPQVPGNWRELTDICCGNCSDEDGEKGRRFKQEIRVKKREALHPENTTGMPQYFMLHLHVCCDCGQELYYVDNDIHKNSKERASHSLM